MPTFSCCESILPLASPLNAQFLAVLIPIPDQKLTTWSDDPTGSIEDLSVILKSHQILLLIIPGTVHIPRVETKGRKYQVSSSISASSSLIVPSASMFWCFHSPSYFSKNIMFSSIFFIMYILAPSPAHLYQSPFFPQEPSFQSSISDF